MATPTSRDHKDVRELIENLREHAYRVAGGGTGDATYDPETLDVESRAADALERLLAENEALEVQCDALSRNEAAAVAENEALREQLGRYEQHMAKGVKPLDAARREESQRIDFTADEWEEVRIYNRALVSVALAIRARGQR